MMIARLPLFTLSFGLTLPLLSTAVSAEDYFLTYHVERFDSAALGIEACGQAAAQAASTAGLSADSQTAEGQLVTVRGGQTDVGSFVVQCIAVDAKTVAVVHGIDYAVAPGAMQAFADTVFVAIKAAAK